MQDKSRYKQTSKSAGGARAEDRSPSKPDLPLIRGVKTPLVTRGPAKCLPSPLPRPAEAVNGGHAEFRGPIYAEAEVCRQFEINAPVKPADGSVQELVMYGELAQASPVV